MSLPVDSIRLTGDRLALDALLGRLGQDANGADPGADREGGALVTFSGIVREREGEAKITHLDYEAYAAMALRQMEGLVAEARSRWPLLRVGLEHRTGAVAVGDPSVIVAVLAAHRGEAFEAARFLIDELKARVPIWKHTPGNP